MLLVDQLKFEETKTKATKTYFNLSLKTPYFLFFMLFNAKIIVPSSLKVQKKFPSKQSSGKIQLASSQHNHKKRKDSLESNLDRVLFAAQLEFPKILVPMLPQDTSMQILNVPESQNGQNVIFGQLLGAVIYHNFIILILFVFN